jgi:uncharacterized protein (TIGR03437 family)
MRRDTGIGLACLLSLASSALNAQSRFALASVSAPAAQQGVAYVTQFTASGGVVPYIWSIGSGTLPPGLSLSDFGMLSGTPAATGTYTFTVQAHDCAADQQSASASLTITVYPPLAVTGGGLADGGLNVPYSRTVGAAGGAGPYSFSVAAGSLPDGLSLSASGRLFGIPARTGAFGFSVRVTDATGATAVGAFTMNVAPPALTVSAPSALPAGIVSAPYPGQVLTATGGVGPYRFVTSGSNPPPGLTVSPDGTISGQPTAAGSYAFTVTATDSLGAQSTVTIPVTVQPFSAALVLSSGSLSFSITAGNTVLPDAQSIGVQSSDISKILSYSVSGGDQWLAVSAGSGVTPGVISVGLSNQAMTLTSAGSPYTARLTVSCGGACSGGPQTVTVSLNVTSLPPQLTVSNDSLAFTTTAAAPQAASQSLGIRNTGGGTLGIASATGCGASWCRISAVPGSVAAGATAFATVTADPAGLAAGYYLTSATVVSSAGSASIPVSLFVAKNDSLGLAPSGDNFTIPAGSPASIAPMSFLVTSAGTAPTTWSASVISGGPWLRLQGTGSGTASSGQPGSVSYAIDPATAAGLAVGTYYGTIRLTSPTAVNSPLDFQVVLNIAAQGELPKPYPSPAGLVFSGLAGGSAPAPGMVGVYASSTMPVSYQASASTADGGAWLTVTPAQGSTSAGATAQSTVSVNTGGLAPGVYYGGVSYAFEASAVRTVNVTLVVEATGAASTAHAVQPRASGCTPTVLAPAQTGLVNNFEAPAAWPTPLAIQLLDDCGNFIANGQVVATFSNGDPPLVLSLADAASGLYSGTWTPRQPAQQVTIGSRSAAAGFAAVSSRISGAVTPNAAPILQHNGTLNLFAPQPGAALAPGTLVQINGSYLSAQKASSSTLPLPSALGGTSVIIGGLPAPVSSVSPTQIQAQIPFELNPDQQYQVIVSANGALTTPDVLQLQGATPGVKSTISGFIQAQHADGTAVTDSAPAAPGEAISLLVAGMGLTDQTVASGAAAPASPPAHPVLDPAVTLDSTPVTVVSSELLPGQVGVYRIVMKVPDYANAGDLTLSVTQDSQSASGILPVL